MGASEQPSSHRKEHEYNERKDDESGIGGGFPDEDEIGREHRYQEDPELDEGTHSPRYYVHGCVADTFSKVIFLRGTVWFC